MAARTVTVKGRIYEITGARTVTVKGQVFEEDVAAAPAGGRTAINLAGQGGGLASHGGLAGRKGGLAG